MKKEVLFELKNISKDYVNKVKVPALKDINLKIYKGETLVIVGPSGSGKSTLLHIISGLDKPSKGTVSFNDKNLKTFKDKEISKFRNENIGFIFQEFQLYPSLTVEENVALPLFLSNKSKSNWEEQAHDILKRINLYKRRDHMPTELSGGERQRVAIGRALMNKPLIILADEPTGNLDSVTGKQCIDLLQNIHDQEDITLIIVSHDMKITAIADRVLKLKDGNLTEQNHDKRYVC